LEAQRKEDELIKQQNDDINKLQNANLLNILKNEESKAGNSQTTYQKRGRQVSTRMKNPVKYVPDADDEFSNRFGDYLGGGRAGGMSMRSGSMS